MTTPGWSTTGLFVLSIIQLLASVRAKKTKESFRAAVLPNALVAGAISIVFVRGFFGDLPLWIDAPMAILCGLIILIVLGLGLVRLKGYLKKAWLLEHKNDK